MLKDLSRLRNTLLKRYPHPTCLINLWGVPSWRSISPRLKPAEFQFFNPLHHGELVPRMLDLYVQPDRAGNWDPPRLLASSFFKGFYHKVQSPSAAHDVDIGATSHDEAITLGDIRSLPQDQANTLYVQTQSAVDMLSLVRCLQKPSTTRPKKRQRSALRLTHK